ncbi:MAG: thioester-forming surface-anchored protein, partial [Lachnospiraceae bacterium]|nr:thioester-forming surface-anchored protein [Lachnospiraceae bacterium]
GCSSIKVLDLSSFDMRNMISWPYSVQNMFPGMASLEKLILGPNTRFNGYTALSGSWTHEETGLTLSGGELCAQYNAQNSLAYAGTWIRNLPEGHYYRTDGSLGQKNLWEVHTPNDRFKGYCLNLHRSGVGEYLDRILAEDDSVIEQLLCTEEEGSYHGSQPLGNTMREALITLIYYGWPNDAAGIQSRYGISDQEYMEITQNAIWDFTDRYGNPAGPSLYEGASLAAYNELVAQKYAAIEQNCILFLYKSWDPSRQNLLSIMGVDDQEYGGVCVRKQSADGSFNLAGAEFTVYDEEGNPVGTMETGPTGTGYICRTDHSEGLPVGKYSVRETKAPAGYELSDIVYYFEITHANEIVTIGYRIIPGSGGDEAIEEEMIYYDAHDDTYQGGGIAIIKESDTGKMLAGAEFTIYDAEGNAVEVIVTNDAGVAMTGREDLPLGTYTIRETRAPEGHTGTFEEKTVTISEYFQLITLNFEHGSKTGRVQLQAKKELTAEGRTLEAGQFTFQLIDEFGNVIQTAENDAEGNIIFNPIEYTSDDLGYKNYSIIEVIGDDSGILYDPHREKVTVTIYDTGEPELKCTAVYDSDGAVFVNETQEEKHEAVIFKKIFNTDSCLPGAQMELRDVGGRVIDTWTSGSEGHTVELDPGIYVIVEKVAPKGYVKTRNITITVGKDGKITSPSAGAVSGNEVSMYDESVAAVELVFYKTDKNGKKLSGAEFALSGTDADGNAVNATAVSDNNGRVRFTGLTTGEYKLTETKAPEGCIKNNAVWNVHVDYTRILSMTPNVDTNGKASGEYPGGNPYVLEETVTIPGQENLRLKLR